MGRAPVGYKNKVTEDGKKYIGIQEPEASHMKWAFEQIAEGVLATEHIWMKAKEKGLRCSRNSFWNFIKHPCSCAKVFIPKFKDEEAYITEGQHEPIISENLYYKVQEVLENRKRRFETKCSKAVSPRTLALRGFLICPKCDQVMTGSASRGRHKGYYPYYHCKSTCGVRFQAEYVNTLFDRKLRDFIPKPGMAELYKNVICDAYEEAGGKWKMDQSRIIELITNQNNRVTKAMELCLNDDITGSEYKEIKKDAEKTIARHESELKEILQKVEDEIDIKGLVDLAIENLNKLHEFYANADSDIKREITGSIFPENGFLTGNHGSMPNVVGQGLKI